MRVAVRTYDGKRRLYRFADALPHDQARRLVLQEVPVAKVVLVEVVKGPVLNVYPEMAAA